MLNDPTLQEWLEELNNKIPATSEEFSAIMDNLPVELISLANDPDDESTNVLCRACYALGFLQCSAFTANMEIN